MLPSQLRLEALTRRHFLRESQSGLGAAALASLLNGSATAAPADNPLSAKKPPQAGKAKSIIYLHMAGSPPQHDLFDYKPELVKHNLEPCPEKYTKGCLLYTSPSPRD